MKTIPLTKGKVALVDDDDYNEMSKHKWFVSVGKHTCYATRHPKGSSIVRKGLIRMHREIARPAHGLGVDHKNGNGLDNRRSNLRVCSLCQNNQNRKGKSGKFKGVRKSQSSVNPFSAIIKVNKVRIYLGCFPDEISAAHAYDRAAVYYHGQFAKLNFP
jgi:hypothetical protein